MNKDNMETIVLDLEPELKEALWGMRDENGMITLDFPIGKDGALVPVKVYLDEVDDDTLTENPKGDCNGNV